MLSQNHYINLSLAMTMAPDVGTYTSLIQSVGEVLKAENDNEAQWFALPVVLVAGCKKNKPCRSHCLPKPSLPACKTTPTCAPSRKTRNGCPTSSNLPT
nr:hypothetical protein [Neisseria subflava]